MSFRADKVWSFKDSGFERSQNYLENKSEDDVKSLFIELLQNGIHGFCFSIYEDGQKPGDIITEAQVRRRIEILKPHTQWIRSFLRLKATNGCQK